MLSQNLRKFTAVATVTLFALMVLGAFLSPLLYMISVAFKSPVQFSKPLAPLWPATEAAYIHQGEEVTYTYESGGQEGLITLMPGDSYPMYEIPVGEEVENWALMVKKREESFFIDPANPDAGLVRWEGKWRTLNAAWQFDPTWNFTEVIDSLDSAQIPLTQLLRNTLIIAIGGDIGTIISCTLVAYGFSRFRIPGKNILFIILIGTIILPGQVTLIPTYVLWTRIGGIGTFWPLILPHFFANAFNVFLLRQFFMTIPREMDEAAMLDGANPFRTLISVILPQSIPVMVTVFIAHLVWAWNDYFNPYLFLSTRRDLQPISVGIQVFNALYSQRPWLIQATALLGLIVPVAVFFVAQRAFMQGVVMTGVEK